jgi:6-phosphogluconolactonase
LIALDPLDTFIYPVNYPYQQGADQAALSVFSVDAATNSVSGVSGSAFQLLSRQPTSFTVSPSGSFAYYTNDSDHSISWFTTDPTTGSFTVPKGLIPAVTASAPVLISSGRWWPVSSCMPRTASGWVYGFSIDGATGIATAIGSSPYAAGVMSSSVTVDPSSQHLYVVNPNTPSNLPGGGGTNEIFAFNIDPANGVLTSIPGSPFNIARGRETVGTHLAIEPSGRFAYLPSATSSPIYGFTFNPSTGALTTLAGSPFAAGVSPGAPMFRY